MIQRRLKELVRISAILKLKLGNSLGGDESLNITPTIDAPNIPLYRIHR